MDNDTDRVKNFIDQFDPTYPILPLTHITTMYGFRSIMTGMTLDPTECEVFKENLLYLFYGRPSYRASQIAASELNWNLPVGFILKPTAIRSIKRVFPFDSGAFAKGRYGRIFHQDSKIRSFELKPQLVSAAKYTSAFYSGNAHYYRGKSDAALELGNFDFELQGLSYLAEKSGRQIATDEIGTDERASAVEIQTAEQLSIKEGLLGLIVPETLLANTAFADAVDRWELDSHKIITYIEVLGPGSEAWVGTFYEKVEELYRREGFL